MKHGDFFATAGLMCFRKLAASLNYLLILTGEETDSLSDLPNTLYFAHIFMK